VVLETDVKLLTNPMFVRAAAALVIAALAFFVGAMAIRFLRRHMLDESDLSEGAGQENTVFPYSAVIQQLKQQKFQLQTEQQAQQRRAKTSEQITSAVIANLPCGVLLVAPNGLVQQANIAARRMLGFASPSGMGLDGLFRGGNGVLDSGASMPIQEIFSRTTRDQAPTRFEARHTDSKGEERVLAFTLVPLNAGKQKSLGTAAVITDQSDIADSRRTQIMHRETSAEMALELRTSLGAIRECALQMRVVTDPSSIARCANDISSETQRLERVVGGFLAGSKAAQASAGRA
jgi:signal transduction histidine kinase